MNIKKRVDEIEESMQVYKQIIPNSTTSAFTQTAEVHNVLIKIEETREHRNEAYKRYWEYKRIKSEKQKVELEKEISKVQNYPVSGLAKIMTTLGVSLVTASVSTMSLSLMFYSDDSAVNILPMLIGISGIFAIGFILFVFGIRRWDNDEKKQREMYNKYVLTNDST